MGKEDALAEAIANLHRAVKAWVDVGATDQCTNCGNRTHRTQADMDLYGAYRVYEVMTERASGEKRFDSEAPTAKTSLVPHKNK